MIQTTYLDRICYRPECDDRECRVLLPEGVRIGEHATIPPGCITSGILLRRHSTRMSHIRNFAPLTFHPNVSHPKFCSVDIPPGCLTSGILLRRHSIRIFRIRRLMPNGRGGRFNFPGQTYPNPLIALTRRVSQPFCTVPQCSPEASRYVRPTF